MNTIPPIGFGLWKLPKERCAELVYQAIAAGYRHLDSACDYGNEREVGKGIARALEEGVCTRDELWVTSKLWNSFHAPEHVEQALQRSLEDLGLDYLDLYLIHFPIAQAFVPFETRYPPEWFFDPQRPEQGVKLAKVPLQDTWRAMESAQAAGLTHRIGVCNYNSALLQDLLNYADIAPAMLQVELHPYLTQEKLLAFCAKHELPVTGFSPLGSLSYLELSMADEGESILKREEVTAAAQRHGKTPAQVALRWGVQRGTAVIPKTSSLERMSENLAVFDFELSQDEMAAISALNRNRRFNDPGVFAKEAFNSLLPIYD
ncbi:MAG: aldo/keto reductase [Pseudomonadota bacterium]